MTNEEIQAWKESAEAVISGMKDDGDQCPWCGAEKRASLSGQMRRTYQCRSVCFDDRPEEAWRSTDCHLSEAKQLKARVAELEEALQAIINTHDADTLASEIARKALKAKS